VLLQIVLDYSPLFFTSGLCSQLVKPALFVSSAAS